VSKPFWETAYADPGTVTFGGPSQEVRDITSRLHAGAKVLDIGCGEGRNALYLSESGFDVTAVDISETGIWKLRVLAEQRNLRIRSVVCDIRDYSFMEAFDLIMCHGCLHLVERESWQYLIRKFKINTKDGGYNIIVVFTDEIPPPDDLRDFCLGLFREGELFSIYADWNIILQKSYVFEDQHPGSNPHRHPVNKLVAQKLSNNRFIVPSETRVVGSLSKGR